jgi:hypothetical protein
VRLLYLLQKVTQGANGTPAGQRHSVCTNERDDRVYFFAQCIVTNIITDVAKNCKYHCYIYHVITVSIANHISVLASILALY